MFCQMPNMQIQRFPHEGFIASGLAAECIGSSIEHLEALYPGFGAWFHTKVIPGLRSGTRYLLAKTVNGRVLAVAIAKRTREERKLCTMWVAPELSNLEVATTFAQQAFTWLGTSKPLFTVPDVRIDVFKPMLAKWEFNLTQVVVDAYRPYSREFVFNGLLRLNS